MEVWLVSCWSTVHVVVFSIPLGLQETQSRNGKSNFLRFLVGNESGGQ